MTEKHKWGYLNNRLDFKNLVNAYPDRSQPDKAGRASPVFLQTKNGMATCFKREGDIIKKAIKKDKISYYVGWGIAYGTFVGGIFSVLLPEYLLIVLCLGIAFGAVVGVIFGKRKLSMKEPPVSHY